MIVYEGTKKTFLNDLDNGELISKIEYLFTQLGIRKEQHSELVSWKNSLPRMAYICTDSRIDENVEIAIEFQIPFTSKRVDFMIAGKNEYSDNVVVVV